MIRRILLRRFGKFRDASFELGELTVFFGPNESGKTTILDAFLQALCRPPRNKKAGQELATRYGEELDVALDADRAIPRLDPEEFLSLLAVSSGGLREDIHVHPGIRADDAWEWVTERPLRLRLLHLTLVDPRERIGFLPTPVMLLANAVREIRRRLTALRRRGPR